MNIIRSALLRALIYVGLVLFVALLPVGISLVAGGSVQVHFEGVYAILFDNSVTFLPLALIAAVSMDYFYSRTFVLTKELEGILFVFFPFALITFMYSVFFAIHSSRPPTDDFMVVLAIVQIWLAFSSTVYATGVKYIMFVTEGNKS
jgi:hypothetical protein